MGGIVASSAHGVREEHPEALGSLGQPVEGAVLDVIGQHERIALAVGVGGRRYAVPGRVVHDRKGVSGGRPERQGLDALCSLAVATLVKACSQMRLRFVLRK